MKTVRKAAGYKLFGGKDFSENQKTNETIIEVDSTKKVRYLNLKILGTIDDYKIKLGKKKVNLFILRHLHNIVGMQIAV